MSDPRTLSVLIKWRLRGAYVTLSTYIGWHPDHRACVGQWTVREEEWPSVLDWLTTTDHVVDVEELREPHAW